MLQPSTSSIGTATLARLKRMSMMRPATKPRTIGSASEFDAMLAEGGLTRASLSLAPSLGSPAATDRPQIDEQGNKILGGGAGRQSLGRPSESYPPLPHCHRQEEDEIARYQNDLEERRGGRGCKFAINSLNVLPPP